MCLKSASTVLANFGVKRVKLKDIVVVSRLPAPFQHVAWCLSLHMHIDAWVTRVTCDHTYLY